MAASCLFGLEAELALGATTEGTSIPVDRAVDALARLAERKLVHLRDGGSRMYLANGSLFYVDHGHHPEIATPECTTPWEAVCHLLAGQRMVARLASLVREEIGAEQVLVFRNNVDYLSGATWGCHESYLGRQPVGTYESWLVPHLVSRIVYTGSGGLDPSSPGIRLSISPRVAFIDEVASANSTGDRGIFHTRDESLSSGYSRVHVLAGDNACSQRAIWLKVGASALVVALADLQARAECPIRLSDPVGAMKCFARNPLGETSVELAGGLQVQMTAVGIQRHLLSMIEPHAGSSRLPDWAPAICTAWKDALDLVETPAIHHSHAFDWPLKFALFRREMGRHGFTETAVDAWSDVLERISPPQLPSRDSLLVDYARIRCFRRKRELHRAALAEAGRLADRGLSSKQLESFNALRLQLCALDVRFGELGSGIFESLDRQSVIPDHRVVTDRMICDAEDQAPAGSRAALRGRWIKKLSRSQERFHCSWSRISGVERQLDMSDPFATKGRFARVPQAARDPDVSSSEFRQTALQRYLDGDYSGAKSLLRALIARGFEIPGTHCHLARVLLVQGGDRLSEAVNETAAAWAHRAQAPTYVIARILWLQLALLYSLPAEECRTDTAQVILGRLKTVIAAPHAHIDWSMDPVIARLQPRLPADQHQLLTALVAALSDRGSLPSLEQHPAWRDAQAEPLA
jgi:proteasome accessory factor A